MAAYRYLYLALQTPNVDTKIADILIPPGGLKSRNKIPTLDDYVERWPALLDREDYITPQQLSQLPVQEEPTGPGPVASVSYTFVQLTPSDHWIVPHNLGFQPQVTTMDFGGNEFVAEVVHVNENQCIIYMSSERTGTARCS